MVGILGEPMLHIELFADFIIIANHLRNPGQCSSSPIRIWKVRGMAPQLGQGIRVGFGRAYPQVEQLGGKAFIRIFDQSRSKYEDPEK
jgi:hypothetical protein